MSSTSDPSEIERILLKEIGGLRGGNAGDISARTPLQDLGFDSLRLFELFVLVEKEFGVSLLESPLTRETLENLGSLSRHIASLIPK